jgi:hypothetical protein
LSTPEELDLAAEAELVAFLWRAAPHCSLVHDVGMGVDRAVKDAARWSGVDADVDVPENASAILACAPGDVGKLPSMELIEIGTVA